jgi:serine/threonine protein kinase
VLLDPIICISRANINSALRDIRNFARRLKHTDPFTFGLLECKGILNEDGSDTKLNTATPPTGLSFVFRMPPTLSHAQSLRHRLLSGPSGEHDSLSARFDLARQLVNAVSYVHLYEFVHKNIRPETILILSGGNYGSTDSRGSDEAAVLVGFDVLRGAEGQTNRLGDDDWEKNLYRHPRRQGKTLNTDYNMRHDIYSVGVCLLEIGLWGSFVEYEILDEKDHRPFSLGSTIAVEAGITSGSEFLKSPERVKDRLLQLARGALRRNMGNKYSKVVETCLTCLDEDNEDFGDDNEFQDEDGFAVGAMYIEKVVQRLGEISV